MMRFYRHVLACNQWTPDRFVPFLAVGRQIGWLRRDHAGQLANFSEIFEHSDGVVRFRPEFETPDQRSLAIDQVGRTLVEQGFASPYRHEAFAVVPEWGAETCFTLDRALVPYFGVKGFGVHLNGYVRTAQGIEMWIGHRSATKKVDPLKLDNVVAGGIAAGHGVWDTLLKEGAEEAAMTPEILAAAQSAGQIRYRLGVPEGMRDDILFLYDLELPADFMPRNTDGEFDSFELMPIGQCLELVAGSDQFKFNVNLTVIDFALRHGMIAPDHPEYELLESGLRGGLIQEAEARTD